MKCHECGKEMSEKSKFCRFCGKEVTPSLNMRLATSDRRLINYLIDGFLGIFVFTFAVGFVLVFIGFGDLLNSEFANSRAFNYLCYFVYFLLLESVFQRSLGKLITKTVVVSENGDKPTFSQIFKRSLIRLIPFEAFSFFGNKGNLGEDGKHRPVGWHDKWSRTRVIEIR